MSVTCRQCGKPSLSPIDAHEAEEALLGISLGLDASVVLECQGCGHQQRSRNVEEIAAALYEPEAP